MLRLLLTSLDTLGEYTGDSLIISDRSADELGAVKPAAMWTRTHVLHRKLPTASEPQRTS